MVHEQAIAFEFLNAVAHEFVNHREIRDLLQANSLMPGSWPNLPVTDVLLEFEREESSGLGSFLATQKIAKWKKAKLPPTEDMFLSSLRKSLDLLHAVSLVDKLTKAPLRWREIISQTDATDREQIKKYRLKENLKSSLTAVYTKSDLGTFTKIVPGWPHLSNEVGGFNGGRVSLFTAESGVGKTNFGINFAYAFSKIGSVIYCNLEMVREDFDVRFMQSSTGLSYSDLKKNNWDFAKVNEWVDQLVTRKNITILEGSTISPSRIAVEVRSEKLNDPELGLLIVDYDQKLELDNRTEEWQAMKRTVEGLERLAKENDVHVILIAQSDESGSPKSSKRAIQPATNLLYLFENEGKFFIKLKKARFGRKDALIRVDYDPSKSLIRENPSEPIFEKAKVTKYS